LTAKKIELLPRSGALNLARSLRGRVVYQENISSRQRRLNSVFNIQSSLPRRCDVLPRFRALKDTAKFIRPLRGQNASSAPHSEQT